MRAVFKFTKMIKTDEAAVPNAYLVFRSGAFEINFDEALKIRLLNYMGPGVPLKNRGFFSADGSGSRDSFDVFSIDELRDITATDNAVYEISLDSPYTEITKV